MQHNHISTQFDAQLEQVRSRVLQMGGAVEDQLFIAKALERVGDHAKNISEYVVYMIKGKDVRHLSADEIEQTVKS